MRTVSPFEKQKKKSKRTPHESTQIEPSVLSVMDIVEHFGSQSALARAIKIKQPSVQCWIRTNHLPLDRAVQIEQITGGKFSLDKTIHLTNTDPHLLESLRTMIDIRDRKLAKQKDSK